MHRLAPIVALLLLADPARTRAGETKGTFSIDGKATAVSHAYAFDFPFELPGPDGKLESIRVVAFSDRPFDEAALDRTCGPDVDIDARALDGALVLNVGYGARTGTPQILKYRAAGMESFANAQPEMDGTRLELEKGAAGSVRGQLHIQGNPQMHEFDPENVPLVQADVAFDAHYAPAANEVKGEALPAGGGAPGAAWVAFNDAVGGKDPKQPLGYLRPTLQRAFAETPPEALAEIKRSDAKVEGGTSDGERARVVVASAGPDGAVQREQICMILLDGRWVVDGFLPAPAE